RGHVHRALPAEGGRLGLEGETRGGGDAEADEDAECYEEEEGGGDEEAEESFHERFRRRACCRSRPRRSMRGARRRARPGQTLVAWARTPRERGIRTSRGFVSR